MVPRNLRKPTAKRSHFWWRDFTRFWFLLGRNHYDAVVPWDDDE